MGRKTIMALAIGAALLGAAAPRASAQSVRVVVGAPAVYVGAIVASPGPGYVWVPEFHRWCYRGVAVGPAYYYGAPVRYGWAPRPYVRARFGYRRGW